MVGFPERGEAPPKSSSLPKGAAYNSLCLVGPASRSDSVSNRITVYRKHFLFMVDESWASEGEGFVAIDIDLDLGETEICKRVDYRLRAEEGEEVNLTDNVNVRMKEDEPWGVDDSVAEVDRKGKRRIRICPCICMDLNPYRYLSPFSSYELSSFASKTKADLVLCSMAWLAPKDEDEVSKDRAKKDSKLQTVLRTISYWVQRCSPLLEPTQSSDSKDTYFIGCNRVGSENDTLFAGSSTVVRLSSRESRPSVLGYLGPDPEEALLRVEVEIGGSGKYEESDDNESEANNS